MKHKAYEKPTAKYVACDMRDIVTASANLTDGVSVQWSWHDTVSDSLGNDGEAGK